MTTVANSGTCYNLTLIDKITDKNGTLLEDRSAEVRNYVEMDESSWNAIHTGMRGVVERMSYYADLGVNTRTTLCLSAMRPMKIRKFP